MTRYSTSFLIAIATVFIPCMAAEAAPIQATFRVVVDVSGNYDVFVPNAGVYASHVLTDPIVFDLNVAFDDSLTSWAYDANSGTYSASFESQRPTFSSVPLPAVPEPATISATYFHATFGGGPTSRSADIDINIYGPNYWFEIALTDLHFGPGPLPLQPPTATDFLQALSFDGSEPLYTHYDESGRPFPNAYNFLFISTPGFLGPGAYAFEGKATLVETSTPSQVPEPTTFALMMTGGLLCCGRRLRFAHRILARFA